MTVYIDLKAENINTEEDFKRSVERGLSEEEKRVKNKQSVEKSTQLNLQD